MTAQEIFDKVILHLRLQGPCMMNNVRVCRYRGSNNMTCAIGILIPDNLYLPLMERNTISSMINHLFVLGDRYRDLYLMFKEHERLLDHLQLIHDSHTQSSWEDHWKFLAMTYDLKYNSRVKRSQLPSANATNVDATR